MRLTACCLPGCGGSGSFASGEVAGADGLLPPPQPSPTGEGAVCWQVSDVVVSRFSHPLPNPSPRERERVAADSGVAGRLKKNAEISTAGIFQAAFITRQMEQTPQAFFQTAFEPSVGCVP